MSAPRLNRLLHLEAPQQTADGAGGFALSWVALGALWAEVVAGPGREVAGPGVRVSATPYRITLRAAAPGAPARPKPGQRLRDGERLFTILSVAERDSDGRYLTCTAVEEMPA